jgi:hypothetical protein
MEDTMKNKVFLAGIFGLMLIFGIIVMSCDNGSTDSGGSNYGTLTLHNSTTYDNDDIVLVELYKGTAIRGTPAVSYNVPISRGSNHSWNLDPGAYVVYVVYAADTYEEDPLTTLVNISTGETTNVTYNGDVLR